MQLQRGDSLPSLAPEPSTFSANVILFSSDKDPDNPKAWSLWKKWRVLAILQLCCLCVTTNATIVIGAYDDLRSCFSVSRHIVILSVSLYVLGLGIGSLLFAPLSELYGRRPICIFSFALFILFSFPLVLLPRGHVGFALLCMLRFLQGVVASAQLSVANGAISDVFTVTRAFLPVSLYAQVPFLGPVLGPIMGALLERYCGSNKSDRNPLERDNQAHVWNLLIYFTVTIYSTIYLLLFCFVPETYTPILLVNRARRLRTETGNKNLYALHEEKMKAIASSTRTANLPKLLVLLKVTLLGSSLPLLMEPLLLILSIWSALLLSILYLFFQLFPLVFSSTYGFPALESSLSLLGIAVGMLLAMLSMPLWRILYNRQLSANLKTAEGKPRTIFSRLLQRPAIASPEARLPMAFLGCFLSPLSLFLFAMSSRGPHPLPHSSSPSSSSLMMMMNELPPKARPPHWILPILSTAPFGSALIFLFTPLQLYLNETYLPVVASATSVSILIRSTWCASLPMLTHFLNEKLGPRGLGILLATVQLLMIPIPFILYFFGPHIRRRSRFFLCVL